MRYSQDVFQSKIEGKENTENEAKVNQNLCGSQCGRVNQPEAAHEVYIEMWRN